MTYKEIKAKHNLTDKHFADWFGYSTANVFRNSSKFKIVQSGIESLYSKINSDKEVKKEEVINNVVEQIKKL